MSDRSLVSPTLASRTGCFEAFEFLKQREPIGSICFAFGVFLIAEQTLDNDRIAIARLGNQRTLLDKTISGVRKVSHHLAK